MKFIYTIICLLILSQAEATIRRVRVFPSYSGDGSSWSQAYNNLQTALNLSYSGDEVWVGQGTYTPATNTSFEIRPGVKVYGGFSATNNSVGFNDRDWKLYPTILQKGSSNYSIISMSGATSLNLLEGFTLKSGYSTGDGGGIYIGGSHSEQPVFRKLVFDDCNATNYGGAIRLNDVSASFDNVLFKGCGAPNGGAIYCDGATVNMSNTVFQGNTATDGGAVNLYGDAAVSSTFKNVVFYNNYAYSVGAGVFCNTASGYFTNCTFAYNTCGIAAGGAIHTYRPGGSTITTNSTVTNCLFYGNNQSGSSTSPSDIGTQNASTTVTYSYFRETGTYTGAGNITSTVNPFVNIGNPSGSDNTWMTADDGLAATFCSGVIDKGNNSAINTLSTDIAGQLRIKDVDLISNGPLGVNSTVDFGAYENQTAITAFQLSGSISGGHVIPTPQELFPDFITSSATPLTGVKRWQKSEDNGANWIDWPGLSPMDSVGYRLPVLTVTTLFRRVTSSATYCNTDYPTNTVQIKVTSSNGTISGKVFSNNTTTGVRGITIKIKRIGNATSGSPAGYTYTAVTGDDGTYSINPIYYGDQSVNTSKDSFWVVPTRPNHTFSLDSVKKTLSTSSPGISGVDFKDLTTYAIAGKTFQQLVYTDPLTNIVSNNQTCPVAGVEIWKDGVFNTRSVWDGSNSMYGVTISDPGTIKLHPKYNSHVFTPDTIRLNVETDVSNQNFRDVTNHTITGQLTAGCGSPIVGTAALEFSSVTPDGTICFTRNVKIDSLNGGSFTVSLPARSYKVRLIRFKPKSGANADSASVVPFINSLPSDSLTRDITTRDTTLNLVYMRPPVISITGLNIVCTAPTSFALIPQTVTDSFNVFVYQGASSYGCPVVDTSRMRLVTNVQGDDGLEEIRVAPNANGVKIKLKGGIPNITSDHLKDLFIYFTDKYARVATDFTRKVLVTGVKADVGTFTTVSPAIPLLVLHDPPGDMSFSKWEGSHSIENAMRIYSGSSNAVGGWLEAKIGTRFQAGIGVSTETSIWGSVNANISTTSTNTTSGETILKTTTTNSFETSGNDDVIGSTGDVYIGAALNLKYSTATEIGYSNCNITSVKKLAVADSGFATHYIYAEDHIRNTIIPQLYLFISLTTSPTVIAGYLNQIHVWQQVLDNNAANKARAAFVENWSFDGAAGPYTNTTTTSSTKSSTIEFNMDLETSVAAALGLEIAGSGVSGGVSVAFKMETGASNSNTVMNETSISYTLDDKNTGDYFSVNVKKDPVYNTPVFELAAGTSSCPQEEGTQPRDDMYFTAVNPVAQNVPAGDEAIFRLKIVNTSQSHETRQYQLSYDQGSNVDNETIKIAGTAYSQPADLDPLGYLDSTFKTVSVKRSAGSNIFSYEGIRFRVSDKCGSSSNVSKTLLVTAQFVAPCSSIALTQPENNWLINLASNNLIFIKPANYNIAALTSVTLEFSQGNTSNWSQGPTLTSTQLANGFNWNVTSLADGNYNLRLRLDCSQGTVYTQRVSGIIDRTAPALFGRPTPTNDRYVNGDVISFSYNEKIMNTLDSSQVSVRRLGNNRNIPVTISGYDNKIIIVPDTNIAAYNGDSIRVIVKNVADQFGNVKTTPDTLKFLIGTSVIAMGNKVLTISITNPTVYKNSDSTINVFFNLSANAPDSMRVNYSSGGTARLGIDYNISYVSPQPLYAFYNGAQGAIQINKNQRQAVLKIDPIGDSLLAPDKTISVSINEGGDYGLGATTVVAGKISSEDSVMVYTFTGDGNFNVKSNWLNGKMPLTTLAQGKQIIINPSGTCTLNEPLTVKPTAIITVKQNKQFIIQGSLRLQ